MTETELSPRSDQRNSRVLFVPSNDTQSEMFLRICNELPSGLSAEFLNLDEYYQQNSMTVLGESRFRVTSLETSVNVRINLVRPGRIGKLIFTLSVRRPLFRLLQEIEPDILVVGNDSGLLEYLVVRWAHEQGKPSLLVQDGLRRQRKVPERLTPRKRFWRFLMRLARGYWQSEGYGHGGCTRIAVSGPATKEQLVQEGISDHRIIVTGQPRYDHLRLAPLRAKTNVQEPATVVFADQPFGAWECSEAEEHSFMLNVLRELCEIDSILPVIKPHPRRPRGQLRNWIEQEQLQKVKVCDEPNMISVLQTTDLLIAVNSTAGLEALILGIPLVTLEFPGTPWDEPYSIAGVATKVTETHQLSQAVKLLLFDNARAVDASARRRFVFDQVYHLDGKASQRVADVLADLSRSLDT